MRSQVTRRGLLQYGTPVVGGLLAGCAGRLDGGQSSGRIDGVVVCNDTKERRRGTVEIVRVADSETVLAETFAFDARTSTGGTPKPNCVSYEDPISKPGPHRVSVSLDSGQSRTEEWDVPGADGAHDEAYGLEVYLESAGIRTQEVEKPAP